MTLTTAPWGWDYHPLYFADEEMQRLSAWGHITVLTLYCHQRLRPTFPVRWVGQMGPILGNREGNTTPSKLWNQRTHVVCRLCWFRGTAPVKVQPEKQTLLSIYLKQRIQYKKIGYAGSAKKSPRDGEAALGSAGVGRRKAFSGSLRAGVPTADLSAGATEELLNPSPFIRRQSPTA